MVLASLILFGVLPGASLGALGAAWGCPVDSQRGAWGLHLCLGWALGNFWGHLGPDDGPWGSIFAPFLAPFGACFDVFIVVGSLPLVSNDLVLPSLVFAKKINEFLKIAEFV